MTGAPIPIGGGRAAPDLVTLTSWGSAALVDIAGWDQEAERLGEGLTGGHCSEHIELSATQSIAVFRFGPGATVNEVTAVVIDYASGAYSAGTLNNLSAHFSETASGQVKCLQIDSDTVAIIAAKASSPRGIECGVFDISNRVLSLTGSIKTFTTATDASGSLDCFGAALFDANTIIIGCRNDNATDELQLIPWTFTGTQNLGSAVATGGDSVSGHSRCHIWKGTELGTKAYSYDGARIHEWTVTPGTTPSIAHAADHSSVDHSQILLTGYSDQVLKAATDINDGQALFPDGTSVMQYFGGRAGSYVNVSAHKLQAKPGAIVPTAGNGTRWVKIDEAGGWGRYIRLGANTTTGLVANAVNVHYASGGVVTGPDLTTTNFTPWTTSPTNLALINHAGEGKCTVWGEDLPNQDNSYLTLNYTS